VARFSVGSARQNAQMKVVDSGLRNARRSQAHPTDYFAAFLAFAQRAFCAAAILARASGESWRFFGADLAAILFFRPFVPVPVKIARTCWSLPISASICASMPCVSILKVYQ
jgi:hypothetical protein